MGMLLRNLVQRVQEHEIMLTAYIKYWMPYLLNHELVKSSPIEGKHMAYNKWLSINIKKISVIFNIKLSNKRHSGDGKQATHEQQAHGQVQTKLQVQANKSKALKGSWVMHKGLGLLFSAAAKSRRKGEDWAVRAQAQTSKELLLLEANNQRC